MKSKRHRASIRLRFSHEERKSRGSLEIALQKGTHTITLSDLPERVKRASIQVEGEATAPLEIGSVDSRVIFVDVASGEGVLDDTARKKLEDQLERLRDKRAVLTDKIEAAEIQKSLISNLAELPRTLPGPNSTQAGQTDWGRIVRVDRAAVGSGR